MPNCFRLYPKGSTEPEALSSIDEKIAAFVGVPVHPTYYVADWYHVIGFLIACRDGCSLGSDKLRAEVTAWYQTGVYATLPDAKAEAPQRSAEMLTILMWLETHYTSDAWVEIGKR